ncbi:MAG TPA: hypothetical protein VLA34_01160, partial [Candidatus Krumholzibacterium sp.]|nr:hypothetical protein [Candidatus Krumholzibacterium sp.]
MKTRSPAVYLRIFIIPIIAVYLCAGCGDSDPASPVGDDPPLDPEPAADTLKVLFIGNSLTHYFDLPGMFRQMAEAAGKDVFVDRMVIGNTSLSDFCGMPECTAKINSDKWHYVSLQGSSPSLVYPELRKYNDRSGLDCLAARMELNCDGSIPVYFMSPGWLDGTTWIEGYSDTYEELAQKIIDETREWAGDTGLMVAPIGAVWKTIVTGHMDIDLFDPDMVHPTLEGTYLNAC